MFNNQITDSKLRKDKEKLENQQKYLEQTKEVKILMGWRQLPYPEQIRIRKDWDNYYAKCRESESCKEYFTLRQALKDKKIKVFKELVDKARARLEEGKWEAKPEGIDPWEFSHGIYETYSFICNRIRQINKQLTGISEDIENIFTEPKKKRDIPLLYND